MPVGLLSSVLLFITWQREGASLGTSWASQAVLCCHDMAQRMPTWEPVGLLSRILLFMLWQREGASLGTSWSSQQCSAVRDMAT